MSTKTRIAFISDLHYCENKSEPGGYSDILLLRAVRRLNRFIKPDLTVIGGDLLENADASGWQGLLNRLKEIIDLLESPVIVLPGGNHDPEPDDFYRVFERPEDFYDIGGVRIMPFIDEPRPGYNSHRSRMDIERLRRQGGEFQGPVVCVQHVPVCTGKISNCPYRCENSAEVLEVMRGAGAVLSLSGHYHPGFGPVERSGIRHAATTAMKNEPFGFLVAELEPGGAVEVRRERLQLPEDTALTDCHVHTSLAYCGENVTVPDAIALGRMFGLKGIVFAEHSGQLYLRRPDYWTGHFTHGLDLDPVVDRTAEYFKLYESTADTDFCRLGMEIDVDCVGRPVMRTELRSRLEYACGAVHALGDVESAQVYDEFLFLTQSILRCGVDTLAHPFRVLRKAGLEVREELFEPVVKMLKNASAAGEINFHTNDPDPEFFRLCVENEVKLVFGSDAHNLYEVGEFYPHLKLVEEIGCRNRLDEIMLKV